MKVLLISLVVFMTLSSAFAWDPGPAPGVTIKNAILYLLTLSLLFRTTLDKSFRIQLPAIQAVFVVLIVYAIISYLAVVLVIDYPHYDIVTNGLNLKGLVDQMLFFLVFFYGSRSRKDAFLLLKCLLAAWALSHIAAVLDAVGIIDLGDVEQREDGRVQGVVGESNQYGAFVALSLPAMIAAAVTTRGLGRLLWTLATLITAVTLIMTVSRGAFVGVTIACVWGMFLFRRYVPARRVAMWAGGVAIAGILVVVVTLALGFGGLLYERLVSDTYSADMVTTSSGRTEIWAGALAAMFEKPLTLLTGFGWRAYWSMPFRFSPHNYYVNQWFNLGLTGLACSVLLFVLPIRAARSAVGQASAEMRAILIGFVVAALAFAVSTFFVDLYSPWLDFWAYAGVVLRIAVDARESAPQVVPSAALARAAPRADSYGWLGAVRRGN